MSGKIMLFCAISVSLVFTPMTPVLMAQESSEPQMSPVPDGSVQYKLYSDRIDQTTRFTRDLRATLDRTAFDFDALLDSLDYDADNIIQFVRTAISFEQYPGVLRGAQGTLFSRAGNSVDQALLLAKLLRDAGYDARVAGAELDAESAVTLLQAMQQPVEPGPPFGDADAILKVFEKYGLIASPPNDESREAYAQYVRSAPVASNSSAYKRVVDTAHFVQAQLDNAGAKIGSSKADARLLEEARAYHWVQFKDAASDPWRDVHPALVDETQFSTVQASSYFSDSVPESLQHKFRFQVFIEQKVGDRLKVTPITAPWERPVANLVGVPLTYSNVSDAMMSSAQAGQSPSDLLASSRFFAPIFSDSLAEGASFFDIRGTRIDPMAAQSSNADFVATVGDAFASAVGGFGDKSTLPTLTAQWLEFTFISPDGKEEVFRRTTFDRLGAAARRDGDVPGDLEPTAMGDARTLVQIHTFMIGASAVPRGYALDSEISRFEGMRGAVDGLMSRQFSRPQAKSSPDVPVAWAKHLALFSIFDMASTIGPFHRNYRSGPGLVIHSIGLGQEDDNIESIDIVSNPRRAVDIRGEIPAISPEYVMHAGVWETAVEGVLLSNDESFDTWKAFESAEEKGVRPTVLLPGGLMSGVEFSADVQAAIEADLESGYAVIVPEVVETINDAGWWRINLKTGETLGQLRDGRGGFAEFLQVLGIGYSGALLVLSVGNCAEGASSHSSMGCCTLGNSLVTLLTLATGSVARAPELLKLGTGVAVDAVAFNLPIGQYCESSYGFGAGFR